MTDPKRVAPIAGADPGEHAEPQGQSVALLLEDQRERWHKGDRVLVEDYLKQQHALESDTEGVLDLVYNEILLREQCGESPQLDEYLGRFPQLTGQLRLQFEVHQAIGSGSTPGSTVRRAEAARASGDGSPLATSTERPTIASYEIVGELGRGGMGVVYRAWQPNLNRTVALKMILAGTHAGPQELVRFRTEAEAIARLQHSNVVPIYEVGQQEGRPYIALEYVEGGSLAQQLAGTPLPARQAAQLAETLARAMHYAHQHGIVHRDLTPSNVLLTADGVPKITDFGLAKILVGGGVVATRSGAILGTPSYMAPEQAAGKAKEVGPATDIYALGAILYELLTGRPPFRAQTPLDTILQVVSQDPVPPTHFQPKLPRDLETICLKCLQKEPRKRYAGASRMAEDLRRFLAGEPIQARPIGVCERAIKWAKRRPAVAALTALILFVTALGLGGVIWQWRRAEVARRDVSIQAEELKGNLYLNLLALAERELAANSVGRAAEVLEACPPELRGWEWHYLKRLRQVSPLTLAHAATPSATFALVPLLARGSHSDVHDDQDPSKQWHTSDGALLISTQEHEPVRFWDATTGRVIRTLEGHSAAFSSVTASPDGSRLAFASADETVRIWDAATGQEIHVLRGHGAVINEVAFSPDGQQLASAGCDKTVRLWDVATGREKLALAGHTDHVTSVAAGIWRPESRSIRRPKP